MLKIRFWIDGSCLMPPGFRVILDTAKPCLNSPTDIFTSSLLRHVCGSSFLVFSKSRMRLILEAPWLGWLFTQHLLQDG